MGIGDGDALLLTFGQFQPSHAYPDTCLTLLAHYFCSRLSPLARITLSLCYAVKGLQERQLQQRNELKIDACVAPGLCFAIRGTSGKAFAAPDQCSCFRLQRSFLKASEGKMRLWGAMHINPEHICQLQRLFLKASDRKTEAGGDAVTSGRRRSGLAGQGCQCCCHEVSQWKISPKIRPGNI